MSLTHTLYPKRILHRLFYVHFCILLLHLGACVTTVGRVSLIVFGPDAGFKFHPFFFPCFPRQVFRWYTVKPSHTFHLAKDTDAFGREKHSHESLARGIQSGLWKLTFFFFSFRCAWWCLELLTSRHERDASLWQALAETHDCLLHKKCFNKQLAFEPSSKRKETHFPCFWSWGWTEYR